MMSQTPFFDANTLKSLMEGPKLAALPLTLATPEKNWTESLAEAKNVGGEIAIWVACAHIAMFLDTYQELIDELYVWLAEDEYGPATMHININDEPYEPGDTGFDAFDEMNERDGLAAANECYHFFHDKAPSNILEVGRDMEEVCGAFENAEAAWTLAREKAPRVHAIMEEAILEMRTTSSNHAKGNKIGRL